MATIGNIGNVPEVSKISDFLSQIRGVSEFAKSARFVVQIGALELLKGSTAGTVEISNPELMYMCETAEMPGRSLEVNEYRYYGPRFKLPHISVYDNLDLTFFVQNNMVQKEFFDNWMYNINPKSTYNFRFLNEYATDITIWQISEYSAASDQSSTNSVQATYKATFRKAYPINVYSMPLSWAEDNFHRLRVTFAYTDWLSEAEKINVKEN